MRIPEHQWVWYGFAGHYCGSKHCAYHLCTRIGGYLVSTVGMYYPPSLPSDKPTPIGCDEDDLLETFVFRCDGEQDGGDPNITSLDPVETKRYGKSLDAEHGHREFCERYAKLEER